MKHPLVFAIPVLALLAACGGAQDGLVSFYGQTPNTAAQKMEDSRKTGFSCPKCKDPVTMQTAQCPKPKNICETQIRWKADYPCMYCNGTGVCRACVNMEQVDGNCYNCSGTGLRVYVGKTIDCPNCKATGKCPICEGDSKCDKCGGSTKISASEVQAMSGQQAAPADAPEEAPAPEGEGQ